METTPILLELTATASAASLVFHPDMPTDPDPMQGLLHLLGRCSLLTLHGIMRRQRQNVHGYRVTITAQRTNTHPKIYTSIDLHFQFAAERLDETKTNQAVRLFAKYCPIHHHLNASMVLAHRWSQEEQG